MKKGKKVNKDNRQRVSEACDACKKSHTKCDEDTYPCKRCLKKGDTCVKPSMLREDSSPDTSPSFLESLDESRGSHATEDTIQHLPENYEFPIPITFPDRFRLRDSHETSFEDRSADLDTFGLKSDKVYKVQILHLMLQGRGRDELFICRESIWSFLQSIRLLIDSDDQDGDEKDTFTNDPERFRMEEPLYPQAPQNMTLPLSSPHLQYRNVLAEIFFARTAGLIEVLDRERFAHCLANPDDQGVSGADRCLLHLVFSIGLVLSEPVHGLERTSQISNAQSHFDTATHHYDMVRQGGVGSSHDVPMLCLQAFYDMMLSKWQTAYHRIRAAVGFAVSAGWHQTSVEISEGRSLYLKRNKWMSLVILQTIISTVLGHSTGLEVLEDIGKPMDAGHLTREDGLRLDALRASYDTCRSMGQTVRNIYQAEHICVRKATEILSQYSKQRLGSPLDAQRLLSDFPPDQLSKAESASLLNVELMDSFGIMLLARPFLYNCIVSKRHGTAWETDIPLRRLAEACIAASTRIIFALYVNMEKHRRVQNPLLLYFCFEAAIILLSNEYFAIFENPSYTRTMEWAKKILDLGDMSETLTRRLVHITRVYEQLVESSSKPLPRIRRPNLPSRHSAGPSDERSAAENYAASFKRNISTNMRNAPEDSRASMASQSAGQGYTPPWPQQGPLTQPHYEHVYQHHQNMLPPGPHTPTGVQQPPMYGAYASYPALEGLGPQVTAGEPRPALYFNGSHYQPNQYWHR